MIKVNVILDEKRWIKFLGNPNNFFKKNLNKINNKCELYKNKELIFTLLLSDTKTIKNLNRRFRKKDRSTDVLSFPFNENKKLNKKLSDDDKVYLGDIIINFNKIKNKKDRSKFIYEFNKIWIHGFTHLLGFKHKTNKEFKLMEKVENKYFNYLY